MMSLNRIKAVILQEFYITKRSLEVVIDVFYTGLITVIVYGFFSLYITGTLKTVSAHYLILGTLLWEVVRITQYSVSVGAMWNIWSRNLSNMFITPLSLTEYISASLISGILKSLVVFFLVSSLCVLFFEFNIFTLGIINLIGFYINLTVFSWSAGIFILGMMFRWGTRIQALSWGLIFLFQPLSATFYPVSVLPPFMQTIAYVIPLTYVFEAARASLSNPDIKWLLHGQAFVLNMVYFILSLLFFYAMFKKSKETGQFSRMEG